MSDADDKRRAIVVALDPAAPGSACLELLRDLAVDRNSELLGLFVEDTELLAHAQSRLATEVLLSGTARPLKVRRLERQLRAQSQSIRRIFEQQAGRLGLPHAFRTLRGKLANELAVAAANAEMLVIELTRPAVNVQSVRGSWLEQLCVADLPNVLYVREGWATARGVLAIIDRPEDVETIGRASARLAGAANTTLTALIGEAMSAQAAEIESVLRRYARTAEVRLEHVGPAGFGARALAHFVVVSDARALVAPAHLTRGDAALVRELLRLTRCSIMIVNAAHRS